MARIRAAAARLGWVPSAAARAMNGAPAQAIGLIVRRPAELLELDPFFAAYLAGVESVLARHQYSAIIRFVEDARQERSAYQQLIAEQRVDGFLLNDLRQPDFRIKLLADVGAKAVVVGKPGRGWPFPSVDTDSADQVRQLLIHFIINGHRKIAHVMGTPELRHAKDREQLWRKTLAEFGLTPGPLVVGNFTAAGGASATRQLIANKTRPTAIFYANDIMAVAGLTVLADNGLRVPDDVAVAGFDDIQLASHTSPTLTTVSCDYRALGRTAADLLLATIADETVDRQTLLPAQIRWRHSN
jgi:DNA-binding LacI/PurR family transcriptional regulator